jgi:hypothetical protein
MTPRAALAAAGLAALAGALSGCGYGAGFRARAGVESVAVPVFENRSLRREVEFPLTEAVVREVQRRTPLAVLPEGRADLVLRGTIESFEQRVLVEGARDEVLESVAVIAVGVVGVDREGREVFRYTGAAGSPAAQRASGPAIVEQAQFAEARGESIARPTSDAFVDLAERIVMLLEERRARPPPGAATAR